MKKCITILAMLLAFGTGLFAQAGSNSNSKQAHQKKQPSNVPADFVHVAGGTFLMGSTDGDDDEKPVHKVTLNSFYICRHEVTQAEWKKVMGSNPSYFKGDNRPVETVSWYGAIEYCNKRSIAEGLTPCYKPRGGRVYSCDFSANGYRLPTEAEWEYAADGGKKTFWQKVFKKKKDFAATAWYRENSGAVTHDVMTKLPNSLGLYDMAGNVWEWCWDWYASYLSADQTNPTGASSGSFRVKRGGYWGSREFGCRPAYRFSYGPGNSYNNFGFRVVRSTID